MENQVLVMTAVLFSLLVAFTSAHAADDSPLQSSDVSADKRPKYMDTRESDFFKLMVMASLKELVEDGELNEGILATSNEKPASSEVQAVAKRMRYMGICMRWHHNTFIPYPCLRSASK